jgi:hypothetical protein
MKKMLYSFCLAFAFFGSCLNAQIDSVFVRNFGGSGSEPIGFGSGYAGAPSVRAVNDSEGNIYLASFTNSNDGDIQSNAGLEDILIVKTDASGNLLWSNTYGGTEFERCYSIKLLSDGNLIIAGKTASPNGTFSGFLGGEDAFLIKISPAGDVIWSRLYGGQQPEAFFDVIELPGGDIMACGISGSVDGDINDATYVGSNKAWLMRVSSTGTPVWSRITNALISNPDWEESFWYVRLNNAQDAVYTLGASYNFNDINSDDLFLSKYSLDGTQSLKKTFGGSAGDSPSGFAVAANDELYAFGSIRGGGDDVTEYFAGNADAWLVKLDSNGEIIWDRTFGGTNLDYAYGLSFNAGKMLLSMSSRSMDLIASTAGLGLSDGFIVDVNPDNGDTLATYRWGSSANDYNHDIIQISESEFYAVGRSEGSDAWISAAKGGSDLVLIHFRDESIGLNDFAETSFKVFPNPATAEINIQLPENYTEIEVFDALGKSVFRGSTTSQIFQLQLGDFPRGLYLISVSSKLKQGRTTSKLLLN